MIVLFRREGVLTEEEVPGLTPERFVRSSTGKKAGKVNFCQRKLF